MSLTGGGGFLGAFEDMASKDIDWGSVLATGAGGLAGLMGGGSSQKPTGYQGTVPKYQAVRQQVPMAEQDPARRPGSGGRQYFTNTQYLPKSDSAGIAAALGKAQEQSNLIAQANIAPTQGGRTALLNTAQSVYPMYTPPPQQIANTAPVTSGGTTNAGGTTNETPSGTTGAGGTTSEAPAMTLRERVSAGIYDNEKAGMTPSQASNASFRAVADSLGISTVELVEQINREFLGTDGSNSGGAAKGGLIGLARGGMAGQPRFLAGGTDGMADKIPAMIEGSQPAKLGHGEFVIPADVVGFLGSGNSEAGAKVLYAMMDRVRNHAHGSKKQIKPANLKKTLPA